MLSLSLMPTGEANAYPPRMFPSRVTLEHYRTLFTRLDMWHYVVNSALLAGSVTVISVFINGMAGYAFAKLRFAGRDGLYRVLAGAMVIPGQVTMLPLFLMVKELGLVNTYAGAMVPWLASIFGIFLVRQYAFAIPEDLLDAARVDGASEWRIFRSVVVPVIRPILLTLAVFTFMGAWNDFLWPLIVLSNDARYTLPVALANLSLEHVQDTELMMAGAVLTVLPVLALFLAMQRYYMDGITAGSVK
ncbi:MAG: carbohydrate ABC transporter permease [Cytophagaceae bacterium]|nr:carbohydrate ABC transporter permease [Gemmatimonadaceae bacterium]